MNINYNVIFKFLIPYFIIAFLAYIIASIFYFILPNDSYVYKNNSINTLEYVRYNINNVFKEKKKIAVKQKKIKKQEYQILSNLKLLAIYAMDNKDGYIILKENNNKISIILSKNEKFKNYVLSEIYKSYAVFTKNKKEYKLSIKEDKEKLKYDILSQKNNIETTKSISVDGDQVVVKRKLINNYIKNFDKIWNDISIQDVKTANGIAGFKITRVKAHTPFAKIGLKKNDIIKSINNIELKSYNDAFKIYKKINSIKSLNIKIIRNNTEKEIYYEIN